MSKQLNIGLFGFGVVGEALYHVLQQTPSLNATIKKVCIRHADKPRNAPDDLFTTNANELLNDAGINVIVELIDDAEAAHRIIRSAIQKGKAVVSANKKAIANNLPELLQLQQEHGAQLLYEAAACASIPVIRNLEEYYDNDLLHGLQGIVNGSTNYILTRITREGLSFAEALQQAQAAGFAESNPALDIEGTDAVNKLAILLTHAYGIVTAPENLLHTGITRIHEEDAAYAGEKGYAIKLVAQARKQQDGSIAAFVLPQFVKKNHQLHNVQYEYNGMLIQSSLADEQFFYGKGAGGFPTASAVLSDLSALRYDYRYEYRKHYNTEPPVLTDDFLLRVYVSFSSGIQVPDKFFTRIERWQGNDERSAVTGIVPFSTLKKSSWWRSKDTSLILCPDAFVNSLKEAQTHAKEASFAVYA